MHENREISNTPWSDNQGRPAKAINRNADAHVLERSDCAVLPVNQLNKEGKPSAEAGEGRAQPKENTDSATHGPDTERETNVPGTGRCAKSSKGKKAGTVHFLVPPPERRFTPGKLCATVI